MKPEILQTTLHPVHVNFYTKYALKGDIACFQRVMEVTDMFKVPTVGNEEPKVVSQFFSKLSKNKINGLSKEKAERDVMDKIPEEDMFYIFEDSHIEAITQCKFSELKCILDIERGIRGTKYSYLQRFVEEDIPLKNICRLQLSTWSIVDITGKTVGRVTG